MAEKKSGNAFDFSLLKRLFRFVSPYKGLWYTAVSITLLVAAVSPVRPYLVEQTIDDTILTGNYRELLIMVSWMVALLFAESVLQFLSTYSSNQLGQFVIRDIRSQLFRHLNRFKLKYFDNTAVGTLVTRVISDIETIASIFSEGFLQILADFLKIFTVIGVMLYQDWKLTLITLIPVPLLVIATNVFKNGIKKTFGEVRNKVAELSAFVQEHVVGMSIVQIFSREDEEMKKFREINGQHRKAHIRSIWYYSVFFPVVEVITAISIGLVVWYAAGEMVAAQSASGEASPGLIISFVLYIYILYRPMRQLADRFNTLQMGVVSAERVFAILDSNPVIEDTGTEDAGNIAGDISFRDVHFAYNDEDYVLNSISFDAYRGEKIALVGATGSGKTSIINLLSRFYEYNSGTIYLDGKKIESYSLNSLHHSVSVVLQDVFLFSDTILNNITLFNPHISEEEVIEASKQIGTHEFISRLPGAYHFHVSERGGLLSAGQKQLISFLRAYVHKPKVLILDEATSSVDTESELLIQKATEVITEGRTSIIIAHRLSTIRHADKILVLEKGRIIETGSHHSLMEKENGAYRKLIELQFAESE
ncbi:MAG: ABC transporter ATP-binding protein [Bacteroidia bacterium]|nr:ABC transporter ATP-binding protein [Bacteroidia bacterium]